VSFAAIRLLIALAILLPVLTLRGTPLPRTRTEISLVAVTGLLLLGLNYILVFWGAQHIPSGLTAVLQATTPAFGVVFISHYLPAERVTFFKLCALALGIAGVAIIFSDQIRIAGWVSLAGCAAVTGGALCVAYSYVLVKTYLNHLNPLALVSGQMFFAVIPLLSLGLAAEGSPLKFHWTPTAVAALLYLALAGSVVAFALNYWLLKHMDAMKIMLMSIVEPPLAMLLGAIILGEKFGGRALVGSGCVLLGTMMSFARTRETEGAARLKESASSQPE
jgi:drug/metabolite transporter (DMT)-like permease